MANLNKVLLIGNLTKDPEIRYTPKGTAVGDLGLAVNRRVKDSNDNWSDETTFVDITVWGNTAENAQKYLSKGRGVFVEGRLQLDTWDDRETGKKRSKLKIVAENLQFLPDGKGGGGGRPSGGSGNAAQSDSTQSGESEQSSPQGGSAAAPSDFDGEEDDIPF